ncbi:DNA-binding protein [bacterium]|nr:DNA-binding protein [bacterium]
MIPTTNKSQEFYSLQEIAEKLNLSRMTVYRYVRSKKLPAYQFGRHYRIRKSDLETFLAQFKF